MTSPSIYSLIALKGSNLCIGHHIIALHGRRKTLLLLEAMVSRSSQGLNREELRQEVYPSARHGADFPSSRLIESQDGSLSKLISRSRRFLIESLRGTVWSDQLNWFVYSEKERMWRLVEDKGIG